MNKAELPIKTKIAVRWLRVIGVFLAIWTLVLWLLVFTYNAAQSTDSYTGPNVSSSWFFIPVVGSIFTIYSGISLSKKSKRAWKVAVIALFITTICSLVGCYFYLSSFNGSLVNVIAIVTSVFVLAEPIVPFTLVILDRKNYFEMVCQRKLEKKELTTEKPGSDPH